MQKTYSKIWLHLVWGTKHRDAVMLGAIKDRICKHLKENAGEKTIYLDTLNGTADHLHALIGLRPDQSASEVANLLKGESSHWVNETMLVPRHFSWQEGFSAFSVSPSHVDAVRHYIKEQERHHRKMTFAEEIERFFKRYGIEQ